MSDMVFRLELGKHSAPGIDRSHNEDNLGYYFPQQSEVLLLRGQMFLIADGNGEAGLGEFASKMAIQTVIQEYYEEPWVGTIEEMLVKCLVRANNIVYDANIENKSTTHFSASVTTAVIHQETLYLAHVGNCRAFLLSNANFEVLTQSHSIDVEKGDRSIHIQGEENGKVLVRSLGIDREVKVDIIQRKLQINDAILLCSDGIYLSLSEQEIQRFVASFSPQQTCELLVRAALDHQTPDDSTALLVKLRSIKRVEGDEKPLPGVPDQIQSTEHQIVIKGTRYRTTWKAEQLPPEQEESMTEFAKNREPRRPLIRRSTPIHSGRQFSPRKMINAMTWLIVMAFIIFLIVKYAPKLWQSNRTATKEKIGVDTLSQRDRLQPKPTQKQNEIEETPAIYPEADQPEAASEFIPAEEPAVSGRASLKVIIIDGSFRSKLSWSNFIEEMKGFSNVDRISQVKSSLKLGKTKLLWFRNGDPQREEMLKQRVIQIQQLFAKYFQVNPEINPLDLTLLIGADFKLPKFQTGYRDVGKGTGTPYYLEILNGYTVPGLAKRLSEQLNYRQLNEHQLMVIDFRNADKKNYKLSFIKTDSTRNDIAAELKRYLRLKGPISNSGLYNIKLIVGTDIVF